MIYTSIALFLMITIDKYFMKRLFNLLTVLFIFSISANAQTNTNTIQVTDMLKIRQISAIQLSPDNKKVLFSVNQIVTDEANPKDYQYQSQIYMANTEGNPEVKALTNGKSGASQAVWSPDGNSIAFVRTVKNQAQLFVLSLHGGEPIQLTDHKYGASSPKWSPDGKKILFSATVPFKSLLQDSTLNPGLTLPVWPTEKPGFLKNEYLKNNTKQNPNGTLAEVRAYLNQNEADKKAKVFNKLNFQGESATNPDYSYSHYFIIDAVEGSTPKSLTSGFYSFRSADFFKDGKTLIISGNIDSLQQPDRSNEGEIYTLNLVTGKLTKILSQAKVNYSNPVISPSGKWLAYQFSPTEGINIPQLAILNLQNPQSNPEIIPFDRNKNTLIWSADEQYLYFNAPSNGGTAILRYSMKRKTIDKFGTDDAGINSFDVGSQKIAYVKTEVANPFEVYVSDLSFQNNHVLTTFNSSWLSGKTLSYPTKKIYVNSKGLKVEYWVMKPTHLKAGNKYPLMLQIHGGPSAMWGPGEASMWHEFQFFAAQGYGIVYANPRGSGGYGEEFLRANYQDWGKGPTEDVLAALEGAVAEGWADEKKLVVTGGSYAGYLTAWIIAHDQRFAAASSQRGVYDLPTFFGEGNAWRLVPNYFGGYPWDKNIDPILKLESPFNYVSQINTPYLIFHGENDLRTGVIQSEMMYKALKVLNKPVEYVRHPGATHELTRSGNVRQRIDQMLRIYEFFERYVK